MRRAGGAATSDGGARFDAGYVFSELVEGRGCSCDIASRSTDRAQVLGALLFGMVFAMRVKRRRQRQCQQPGE